LTLLSEYNVYQHMTIEDEAELIQLRIAGGGAWRVAEKLLLLVVELSPKAPTKHGGDDD